MTAFRDALEQDMVDNHFSPDEFGEVVVYAQASGVSVPIPGIYDEPTIVDGAGAEVGLISREPRFFCRRQDLPTGSPKKGDTVRLEANVWHPALHLEVVDMVSEKLGHVELTLQGSP